MPRIELRPEDLGPGISGRAVDAVRADDQVVRAPQLVECRRGLAVVDADPGLLAPLTQDREQPLPADGREPVAAGGEDLSMEMDVDVVPDRKVLGEPLVEGGVGMFDASERLVGKNDPEAKGVIGGVSLPNLDLMLRV